MKFIVPNYSCPQIPVLCPLSSTEFVEAPPRTKFVGTPLSIANLRVDSASAGFQIAHLEITTLKLYYMTNIARLYKVCANRRFSH